MPSADELLNAEVVACLTACLRKAEPEQHWLAVERSAVAFEAQGLAERVRAVQGALLAELPPDYGIAAGILRCAQRDDAFTGWMIWPVTETVAARALESRREHDFEDGLQLLAELTGRLTSEFALRSFLDADLDRTLRTVATWTAHEDEHVRRLASEGTRPRLPWARRVPALLQRPSATLPILHAIHRDESEYVRRSVANHLNDISRIDPVLAVETATRWLEVGDATSSQLVKRALRTLVKEADPDALALFGFAPPREIHVDGLRIRPTTVAIGDALRFEAEISSTGTRPIDLAIDYVVNHRKANGDLIPKVFKLTTRRLDSGERTELARDHSFKRISTRRYYPGRHSIELQVNGVRYGIAEFDLIEGSTSVETAS
jgi:3-methyladenine DNA glycosylase AlkC